ncbi:WD40/YVTN/BNR-like repeat-containing protein [Neptunomonas concharum]|uniref:Photosynthesis system II assembly factor Ycf48/Hcf136-like domain-containing protein n=1 Tax=Neptunomonas concharum TaxID=1031538 RepID=A0A5P1RC99_9GAMM|nr:YCF48-related protein [Neptunomonas concharum]QEQ97227.1 hypothetical protein F0U83_11160 [Neptunomonas concharum]
MYYSTFKHSINQLALKIFICSLLSCSAYAEYQDPLDIAPIPSSIAKYALLLDIVTIPTRTVCVGERGIIIYSDNRGLSWLQADVPSSTHLNAVFFPDGKTGWAVGEDQVILKTNNGGQKWIHQYDARAGESKGSLLDVWFQDIQQGYAVGAFNTLLRTSDGGHTWENWQTHIDNDDEWHLFSIGAGSKGNIYIASESGLIFRSTDHGENFQALRTSHKGSFHGLIVQGNEAGSDSILAFGVGGVLMLSEDNGENWTQIETGTQAGLSSGVWLNERRALLSAADGAVVVVDLDTKLSKLSSSETGLPLSGIELLDKELIGIVGLGGIQIISVSSLGTQRK